MKKKELTIAVALLIAISVLMIYFSKLGKEEEPEVEKIDYTSNIEFTTEDQLLAIAYLNDIEEVYSKYIDNLENIKVYQISGKETYLIIPRYDTIEINIYKAELEDDELIKGELLTTTNSAFIITCNESDTTSDVIFEIVYNDKSFEYSPNLSSEDKSINTNEYILDITE